MLSCRNGRRLSSAFSSFSHHYSFPQNIHHELTLPSRLPPSPPSSSLRSCNQISSNQRGLSSSVFSSGPYALIQATEVVLDSIHQHTHLPWWSVIVGTTLVLRASITLPLAIYQMKMSAKQELLLPRLKELQEAALHNVVVRCRRANLPHTQANKEFQKEVR